MMETYRRVRSTCGNAAWITEFTLIKYAQKKCFIPLLQEFFWHGICCAVMGTFPAYLVGIFSSFDRVVLAVTETTSSFLDEILQRNRTPNSSFWFGEFKFILETAGVSFIDYKFVLNRSKFFILVHLFDSENCRRGSNLNFVHYIWENYTILPCRKYWMVILETKFLKHARIHYLKHYKAGSDGWTSWLFCNSCVK
jgi:hypothetical protein